MYTHPMIKSFCDRYMEGNEFNDENFDKYNKKMIREFHDGSSTRTDRGTPSLVYAFDRLMGAVGNKFSIEEIRSFIHRFTLVVIENNMVYYDNHQPISGDSVLTTTKGCLDVYRKKISLSQ